MVIRKLLVLFLIIGVCTVPVSADYNSSGTVDYSYSDSLSYDFSGGNSATSSITTTFRHLFTDAKILNTVIFKDVWSSSLSYTKNDVTPFVATVGGGYYGSGVASIVEQLDHSIFYTIDFYTVDADYAQTLSGIHQVSLTFDDTITSGLVGKSMLYSGAGSPYGMDVSHPTQLMFSGASGINSITSSSYNYVQTSYWVDFSNSYNYNLNSTYNISSLVVNRSLSSSLWSVYDSEDTLYFEDESGYSSVLIDQDFLRYAGVYANTTYNTAGGPVSIYTVIDFNGTAVPPDDEDEDDFEYNITTELDEYSPGDTVNVTYTTDQKGTIQVVKTISGDIYHSIGFVSGATNATWDFYIAGNEPYGFYDVYLLDSSNTILDSVRYSLLPTTSSLDILQSSVDLHETFVVFAQTVNESILSIEDPDGVEVWNESIGALMYDYIYYTPTIKQGIYTAYLYDDATLNDTVMVYLADPPIIDDPFDPETNGTIPIEDVLEDDESMTEYFDDKFRKFAPTAWGIFLLSIVLWLMAILSSFGGSGKRR